MKVHFGYEKMIIVYIRTTEANFSDDQMEEGTYNIHDGKRFSPTRVLNTPWNDDVRILLGRKTKLLKGWLYKGDILS